MKNGKAFCGKILIGAAIFGMIVTNVSIPAGFGTETVYAAWEKKYEVNGNVLQLKPVEEQVRRIIDKMDRYFID